MGDLAKKEDDEYGTVFSSPIFYPDIARQEALFHKWGIFEYEFRWQSGNATLVMQKSWINAANQNLQLKVDDLTSQSQAQQTKAQSYMNKYSTVTELASKAEEKCQQLMVSEAAAMDIR
jgi:hypothetical protein